MDKRTKILAFGLIGLIAVWGGAKVLGGYVFEPIENKQRRIDAVDKELSRLHDEQFQIVRTERLLKEWTTRSLPPNDIDAQRLYKEWLTQLADVVGFDGLQVKADRREQKAIGKGRRKTVVFNSVQVKLEGKTTFSRLNRFLYYFNRTKLMHRVNNLDIKSNGNEGDPLISVSLTAEALAFQNVKNRPRLFPETELAADATASELSVKDAKAFPAKGEFHVRVGRDLLKVTKRDGSLWTFRPGIEPLSKETDVPNLEKVSVDSHAKNSRVEFIPLLPPGPSNLLTYYRELFGPGKSPFVLPAPPPVYRPRWSGMRDQRITRRDRVRMKVEAVDLDPKKGSATYTLGKSDLKNLKFDPKTGSIEWEPKQEDEAKSYSVEVLAHQGSATEPILKSSFRITLTDPNRAPTLERLSDKSVMVGRTLKFTARASDPDDEDRRNLKFSLSGAPAGADIGTYSGEFTWTPTEAAVAGDYTITVNVTDGRRTDARNDSRRVTVRLLEDTTRFVNLIGILTDEGERQAWLYDHSTKKKIVVKEGVPFTVAGISGFVFVIGEGFIEFQADGATWRMKSGDSLAARELISAPAPKTVAKKKPAVEPKKIATAPKSSEPKPTEPKTSKPTVRKPVMAKRPAVRSVPTRKDDGDETSSTKKPQ